MSNVVVYDKVSWHYPEGKNCPSLEAAKEHFSVVMKWLKKNRLLSDEGEEIFGLEIDADFSITSSMLGKEGNNIFKKHYSNWLRTINYIQKNDLKLLDDGLQECKRSLNCALFL